LKFINAEELWKKGYTGKNVVVAHLDSGVDSKHVALRNSIEEYAKFGVDGEKLDPPSPYQGYDDHGTHTAGTVAGRAVGNAPVVGVAPDVELIDATIVGGKSSPSRVIAGMDWSLGKGARVMNLSVGFRGHDPSLKPIIEKLRKLQLLPIVAIGNDSAGNTRSPGNYESVLSVGATDENGNVVGFSSSAKPGEDAVGPKICAPGMNILSAKRFGGYFESSGTSMAAPHVAGLAALLLSARPDATIDEIQEAIVASCHNPTRQDASRIGAGIPQAAVALGFLLGQ
jgi:subtilisin family serine protease